MLLLEREFYRRHNITFDNTTGIPRFKVLHAWLDEGGAADARNGSARNPSTSPFAREPPPVPEIPDEITGSAQRRSVQESSLSLKEDAHRQAVALQTIREGSTRLALLALGSL